MFIDEIGVITVDQAAIFQGGCVRHTRGGLLLIFKVVETIQVQVGAKPAELCSKADAVERVDVVDKLCFHSWNWVVAKQRPHIPARANGCSAVLVVAARNFRKHCFFRRSTHIWPIENGRVAGAERDMTCVNSGAGVFAWIFCHGDFVGANGKMRRKKFADADARVGGLELIGGKLTHFIGARVHRNASAHIRSQHGLRGHGAIERDVVVHLLPAHDVVAVGGNHIALQINSLNGFHIQLTGVLANLRHGSRL